MTNAGYMLVRSDVRLDQMECFMKRIVYYLGGQIADTLKFNRDFVPRCHGIDTRRQSALSLLSCRGERGGRPFNSSVEVLRELALKPLEQGVRSIDQRRLRHICDNGMFEN